MKHLSGATLEDRLLALPESIRLGWKGLPGTNALAYYENSYVTAVKSFITLAPDLQEILKQNNSFDLFLIQFTVWKLATIVSLKKIGAPTVALKDRMTLIKTLYFV